MRTGGEGDLDGGAVAAPVDVAVVPVVGAAVSVVDEDEEDGWLVVEFVDGEGGVEVMLVVVAMLGRRWAPGIDMLAGSAGLDSFNDAV